MPTKEEPGYDFAGFLKALRDSGLDRGMAHTTCHFSAVDIAEWDRIRQELASVGSRTAEEERQDGD